MALLTCYCKTFQFGNNEHSVQSQITNARNCLFLGKILFVQFLKLTVCFFSGQWNISCFAILIICFNDALLLQTKLCDRQGKSDFVQPVNNWPSAKPNLSPHSRVCFCICQKQQVHVAAIGLGVEQEAMNQVWLLSLVYLHFWMPERSSF